MIKVKGNGGGASAAKAVFGDGSDGAVVFSADATWAADPEDTGMIVKNFESLVIPEGVTVAAENRNCGMIIRVKGDCTIAGTLANKMSPKTILDSDLVDFSAYPLSMMTTTVAGNGGNGSAAIKSPYHTAAVAGGTAMSGRFYGGGWGAGGAGALGHWSDKVSPIVGHYLGGAGGSTKDITTATTGSVFAGGSGGSGNGSAGARGGGGGGGGGYYSSDGENYKYGKGGKGGTGAGAAGSAPTGNYGGGHGGGAGNYGGGVILLFVGGVLTISGQIDCSGGNGGRGIGAGTYSSGSGGGGGGGRIYIVHRGELDNTGILNVNGGSAGTTSSGYCIGAAGSIGTTSVLTLDEYKAQEVA